MSAWMNAADDIKTRLESLVVLAGVDVIVDRQKSIDSTVAKSVGKANGVCVTIFFSGCGIEGDTDLVTRPVYEIRVYTQPVLQGDDAIPADDLLEAMVAGLHNWHPQSRASHDEKFRVVTDPDLIVDRKYLIYSFHIQGRATLPAPLVVIPPPDIIIVPPA